MRFVTLRCIRISPHSRWPTSAPLLLRIFEGTMFFINLFLFYVCDMFRHCSRIPNSKWRRAQIIETVHYAVLPALLPWILGFNFLFMVPCIVTLYINKIQQDATVCRYLFTAKSLYMFRVYIAPIIRRTSNCNCSLWYRS